MSKRLFFIAVIIMLVFGLSACGSGEDPVAIIAVNNPIGDAAAYDKRKKMHDQPLSNDSYQVIRSSYTIAGLF